MEKVIFIDPETNEEIEFAVEEETQLNGVKYLLVSEETDGECDAYILKEMTEADEDTIYEMVEDDVEMEAISKVFEETLEDIDIEI